MSDIPDVIIKIIQIYREEMDHHLKYKRCITDTFDSMKVFYSLQTPNFGAYLMDVRIVWLEHQIMYYELRVITEYQEILNRNGLSGCFPDLLRTVDCRD